MEFITALDQVVLMFLLMAVGFLANRVGFIHASTSKDLTKILLYIVSPCLIVASFQQPYSSSQLQQFLLALAGSVLSYGIAIAVGSLIFRRIKDADQKKALKYATVYSNAGFMGIPLSGALLGSAGVFYSVPYLMVFNIFNWTHGVSLFRPLEEGPHARRHRTRTVLTNPNLIAILIGLVIFLTSLHLPTILNTGINDIADVNTPLSMIVIGDSIAGLEWRRLFSDILIWPGILIRNLIMPAITLLVLVGLGLHGTVLMATMTMAACPVAGIVVLFTLLTDGDPAFPTKLVSLSTILALVTLPLMLTITAW